MGDGVTDDKDLLIKLGSKQAGGVKGQLIIDDINFNGERDNTEYSGIGNEGTTGIGYGNETYALSFTEILNDAGAELIDETIGDEPISGIVRTPNYEFNLGKLDWNNFDFDASDDGDTTFAADFNVRNVKREKR